MTDAAPTTPPPAEPLRFRGVTYLTPHFSLEELTKTEHRSIDNTAPLPIVDILRRVTAPSMEKVRAALGDRVISVNSGYRCHALNVAIGGAPHSAHELGYAVDFNCYGFGRPIDICRYLVAMPVKFDQLIEEGTWVHISFDPRMRNQVLTKVPGSNPVRYAAGLPGRRAEDLP